MRDILRSVPLAMWVLAGLLSLGAEAPAADRGVVKLEVILIWGTDDAKSPNPDHKPVEADIREKLANMPLKWKNWFEVKRKPVELAESAAEKVELSKKCSVEIKNTGKSTFEISLFGKGETVVKRTQALPKKEVLFLGGNAPNATSWLVAIKRVE